MADLPENVVVAVDPSQEEPFCACGHLVRFHPHGHGCLLDACRCGAFTDAGPICKCGLPRDAHEGGKAPAMRSTCTGFEEPETIPKSEAECLTRVHRARLIDEVEVCGFCNKLGADKVTAPLQYPDQVDPGTPYVHAECEEAEEEECAEAEWARRQREGENPPVAP